MSFFSDINMRILYAIIVVLTVMVIELYRRHNNATKEKDKLKKDNEKNKLTIQELEKRPESGIKQIKILDEDISKEFDNIQKLMVEFIIENRTKLCEMKSVVFSIIDDYDIKSMIEDRKFCTKSLTDIMAIVESEYDMKIATAIDETAIMLNDDYDSIDDTFSDNYINDVNNKYSKPIYMSVTKIIVITLKRYCNNGDFDQKSFKEYLKNIFSKFCEDAELSTLINTKFNFTKKYLNVR